MDIQESLAIVGLKLYPFVLFILKIANHYLNFSNVLDNIMIATLIILLLLMIFNDAPILEWLEKPTLILLALCICYFMVLGTIDIYNALIYNEPVKIIPVVISLLIVSVVAIFV